MVRRAHHNHPEHVEGVPPPLPCGVFFITPQGTPSPVKRLCRNGKMMKNVMLNLFQHLIESMCYETLKRVQGGKK